jgi:hypothetical protein
MAILFAVLSFVINIKPIADGHRLDESLLNEVEHAIDRAERKQKEMSLHKKTKVLEFPAPQKTVGDLFKTNSLNASQIAVKIVSMQQSDGLWRINGTNVTSVAVGILKSLREK